MLRQKYPRFFDKPDYINFPAPIRLPATQRISYVPKVSAAIGGRRRTARKTMRGTGVMSVLKKIHDYAKKNRLGSKGLRHFGFNNAAKAAHVLGYGRKRTTKRKTTMRGTGVMSVLKKIHDYAKKHRLASKGLEHFGFNKAAKAAHVLGYGRRRSMRGRGFFGNIWKGIKSAANWIKDKKIVSTIGNLIPHPAGKVIGGVAGAIGLGRRPRRKPTRMQGGGNIGIMRF